MPETELDQLRRRVERVERELRGWRAIVTAFVAMTGILVLVAASPPQKVAERLVAREFVVADNTGKPHARFGMVGRIAELALDDAEPANLTSRDAVSSISRHPRTQLTSGGLYLEHIHLMAGSKDSFAVSGPKIGNPSITIFGKSGVQRLVLAVDKDGPSVSLWDESGLRQHAVLGYTALENVDTGALEQRSPSSLVVFGRDGKVLWKVP